MRKSSCKIPSAKKAKGRTSVEEGRSFDVGFADADVCRWHTPMQWEGKGARIAKQLWNRAALPDR